MPRKNSSSAPLDAVLLVVSVLALISTRGQMQTLGILQSPVPSTPTQTAIVTGTSTTIFVTTETLLYDLYDCNGDGIPDKQLSCPLGAACAPVYVPPECHLILHGTTTTTQMTTVTVVGGAPAGSVTTGTATCTSTIEFVLTSGQEVPPIALPLRGSCYAFVTVTNPTTLTNSYRLLTTTYPACTTTWTYTGSHLPVPYGVCQETISPSPIWQMLGAFWNWLRCLFGFCSSS